MSGEVIEALAEEVDEAVPERREVAVRSSEPQTLAVAPQIEAGDLVARLDAIKEAQGKAMVEGVDYGVIPGTDKPALMKAGAEKLGVLFQLDIQLENEKEWGPGEHLTVISRATVYHAPTGARLGFGEGICTSREKKYATRKQNRTCPDCGAEAILLSRDEDEGFFCWRKRGGCGHKFPRNDERLTGQEEGEKENPDLPDTWNTIVKMAEKRARVDAVLAVSGASALFTQDVDENVPTAAAAEPAAPAFERATAEEQVQAKRALGAIVGDGARALALYTEALSYFGDVCPKGLAVLLVGLKGAES